MCFATYDSVSQMVPVVGLNACVLPQPFGTSFAKMSLNVCTKIYVVAAGREC